MMNMHLVATIVFGVFLGAQSAAAEDLSRYRNYALGRSVASVVATSGARADTTRTLHERPALVQEIDWRAPYVSPGTEGADSLRGILFSFVDDQLYRLVVTYDPDRTEGLTSDDVIESISATYGMPLLRHAPGAKEDRPDVRTTTTILAQWEDAAATLILMRDIYPAQFRLSLTSKALEAKAAVAIADARRLDTEEAPQRERDRRTKDVTDAREATAKARVVNKAAFKP